MQVRADERRIATVVFADLVGFTSLSEGLDPEQLKNLVDGCFKRMAADIAGFGGHVDKIVGDAIIALFGAPVAHEDDAERAVRAALEMQATLRQFAAEAGTYVEMRVGINTGDAIAGNVGSLDRMEYTVIGDMVNTAFRLASAAGRNQILISKETAGNIQTKIDLIDVGVIKTKDVHIEAFEVIVPRSENLCSSAPFEESGLQ